MTGVAISGLKNLTKQNKLIIINGLTFFQLPDEPLHKILCLPVAVAPPLHEIRFLLPVIVVHAELLGHVPWLCVRVCPIAPQFTAW